MRAVLALLCTPLVAAMGFAASPKAVDKPASDHLMYLSTWPHTIQVVDADQEKVIDHIQLSTDIARLLVLSPDKTKIYASTLRDNCIVTVDLPTRKPGDKFCLNTDTVTNRLSGLAIDPTGKYLYSILTMVTKQLDHYEISKPKLAVIDIAEKKITRAVDYPTDQEPPGARALLRVSPDGKSLYLFRQSILIFSTSDLKFSKKVDFSSPIAPPGMDNLSLNIIDDPNEAPDKLIGVFNASDPYVHREVFGIAEIDMSNQRFDWTPVGPSAASMQPLLLNPDRSLGYTVAVNGTHGDRVTEFWVFDMKTHKIINKKEFVGRTRLNFGMSADGKKLLIYNAGYEIEVYDAKTLTLRSTINLGGDTTSNLIVAPLTR
jgi:hypothetical protein